jgi:Tfp pilus assembly protein PilO
MTTTLYLLTLLLPLATILIVFGMRYYASVQQARARLANDDAYRQLAETASSAQSRTATSLAALQTTLSDMRERMIAVETILKAVE